MPMQIFQQDSGKRRRESLREAVRANKYDYNYPGGLDWTPDGTLHNKMRDEIQRRLQASLSFMQPRYEPWRKIEWTQQAYVPLDEEEKRVKAKDPRKPVSIVVPVSYATKQTILTYLSAAFCGDSPLIPLEARGPEDVVNVALLELLLEYQRQRMKWELALNTQWSDSLSYGLGIVTPRWIRQLGYRTARQETSGVFGILRRMLFLMGEERTREEVVSFEGNRLDAIDPRLYFPDPNAPAHMPEDMEWVGWLVPSHVPALLSEEKNTGTFFNCQYLTHMGDDCRSVILRDGERDKYSKTDTYGVGMPADVAWLYWNLIPSEHGIGDSNYPEPWVFALAGDEVIIAASKLELNHNRFPVTVCCPDTDGRAALPTSRLEVGYGLQEVTDWMISSHVRYTRKMANGAFGYDPEIWNSVALQQISETGGMVPTRRSTWGRGSIKDSIMQFQFGDVTRGHVADAEYLTGLMQRVTGATDIVQGLMRDGGERRSATEASGARSAALSRLEYTARLISIQSMRDLGFMLASQTQQFMSEDTAVRILGRHTERLGQIYGNGFARVSPFDVVADYDVIPRDGTIPNPDNAGAIFGLMDRIMTLPTAMNWNLEGMILAAGRQLGVKDLASFRMQANVMDNAVVEQQLQAGNLVPIEQPRGEVA